MKICPKSELENITSSSIIRQINRIIINKLSRSHPHLLNSQVDLDPRIESCWYAGGMDPPVRIRKFRKTLAWMKEHADDPIDRLMVYIGKPCLTVRSKLPLKTIVTHSEAENPDLQIPFFSYDPRCVGTPTEHRHMANTPEEMKLFEDVKDGKIIGLNEDVLKLLIKFYSNVPENRLGVNMTPYLSSEEKVVADYEDNEKREWLEREYKYLVANRPRHHDFYEIYSWEKIYKIDNKTRFMEKRLRPFELFIKPQNRTLDDRTPKYIPRKLRPDLPRWKGRNAKEFFP
ncbi:hypothetical protein NQ314_000968 [Rhamnusium bicolor]|uniref:Uncharacterized protein n=1 Tax=Rhamnusium bicolor TaxID=1586634 RepID=A0AAV8ZUY7_9CUCU|nr:hypothetical protein NQ314_000968 [Rhamnusium bicolor]